MNYAGLSSLDVLGIMASKVDAMQADLGALLQAQQISNYLALANNMQVPEDVRQQSLQQAMAMMELTKTKAQSAFEELSSEAIR